MSYQINIFSMEVNYCSKDGSINVNRTINKNNHLEDKDNNTNSSTATIQKQLKTEKTTGAQTVVFLESEKGSKILIEDRNTDKIEMLNL